MHVVQQILNKHRVFRRYKDSHHPACVRASRLASRQVKRSKLNFENKLAENIKKDSKSFLLMFVGDHGQQES